MYVPETDATSVIDFFFYCPLSRPLANKKMAMIKQFDRIKLDYETKRNTFNNLYPVISMVYSGGATKYLFTYFIYSFKYSYIIYKFI